MNPKSTIAVLILLAFCGTNLLAKTITDEASGVSIDLPDGDGWKVEEGKAAGQKTTSAIHPDGVSIIVIRFESQLPAVIIKRLADSLSPLVTDAKASDDSKGSVVVHGIQAEEISGNGTREDKPVRFTALLLSSGNNSTLAVIAIGAETPFKRHLRDVDAALASVKPKG